MKKIIWLLIIMFWPLNIMAYSDYVIPGGENMGIKINMPGVMIIGFYRVDGEFIKANPKIKIGDLITKVNNIEINSIYEMQEALKNNENNTILLQCKREQKEVDIKLYTKKVDGVFKTGLYVKDNLVGIGTLSYIDPNSNVFGALGHEVIESVSQQRIEVKTGNIFKSTIESIDRSREGIPGGKNARFYYNEHLGNVKTNTSKGIYGIYSQPLPDKELLEVGDVDDIKLGEADILTVMDNTTIKEYKINIIKLDTNSNTKNFLFEINDKELLATAGGVIQGMSGSPIIQNNRIIGAVTHVIIDNPHKGYGIFIVNMLKEGDKLL